MHSYKIIIPYKAKFSRGKTFAVFMVVHFTMDVFLVIHSHVDWQYKYTNMLLQSFFTE